MSVIMWSITATLRLQEASTTLLRGFGTYS